MSLGTASLTPLSMARGYSVFANGGSLVTPWFIDEVKDREGNVVFKENPATACRSCSPGTAVSYTHLDVYKRQPASWWK